MSEPAVHVSSAMVDVLPPAETAHVERVTAARGDLKHQRQIVLDQFAADCNEAVYYYRDALKMLDGIRERVKESLTVRTAMRERGFDPDSVYSFLTVERAQLQNAKDRYELQVFGFVNHPLGKEHL